MPSADLLIHNIGQLVTCRSTDGRAKHGASMLDASIIGNGAVAIADGKISAVGTLDEVEAEYSSTEKIDAGGKAVTPGFVDPHTHIVYSGDRLGEFELKIRGAEYLEILAAGGGIISTVTNTRAASLHELVDGALKRLDKMLACGTTTAEIKTGYGLDPETELKMLRVIERLDQEHAIDIVPTFLAAHTVPPEFKGNTDGYVDLICGEMLKAAWEWYEASHFLANGTPFFCDVFTEKNAFDRTQTERILGTAKDLGFRIKAHVDQFTNLTGSQLAIETGAVSIDHLDAISDDEIKLLAKSDTIGVVIPTENFSAGKTQFAPARKLIDTGCAVAISTDYNPGSAPCPSQQMAIAIATRYQKLLPSEALNAVTVNAAFAIGLGSSHGSIEVGKQADLLILDCEDYRQIAYEFGGNLVASVIKRGQIVYGSR
ncbi:MAG: imidazolonepropionase [Acidobacteria bacterium ACB1]|nr:Imidazolonepropionase [Pyrinomonadaceae bacterium]MCE7963432.1 imidazolonepropionase [Acidobacteria bacterium ACB1]RIJ94995.1 MAG: imidazolonepropionase [Acidobacteriota bacterium]